MQHRIALIGRTLGVATIGASLEGDQKFELVQFVGQLTTLSAWLDVVQPEAIIFDIATASDCPIVGSLRRPGLLLIGCDLSAHEMVVLSGEQVTLSTKEDLLRVLSRHHLCETEAAVWP